MSKEYVNLSKKYELEFFIHIINTKRISFEEFDGDDGFQISREKENLDDYTYTPYVKYTLLLKSLINKMKKIDIDFMYDYEEKEYEAENNKTKYSYKRRIYKFVFIDPSIKYSINALSFDERVESALLICYLLFYHNQAFNLEIGQEMFGENFTRKNFMNIRNALKEVTGNELKKNDNGNYHFIEFDNWL